MNLEEHMKRQMAFSKATYGPDERREGIINHIKKEIKEVQVDGDPREWVDLVLLSLDGLWRSLYHEELEFPFDLDKNEWVDIPYIICELIEEKQAKNEQREWPDYRTADPTKAIEHDRSKD